MGRKLWPVAVEDDTRYRVTLIASVYGLSLGDVIDRAVISYANQLKIQDKMAEMFPPEGVRAPVAKGMTNQRRTRSLSRFPQHAEMIQKLTGNGTPEDA